MRSIRGELALSAVLILLGGCSGARSRGGALPTSSAGTTSARATRAPATTPAPLSAPQVLPLILIHGHGGDFSDWDGFIARYGKGRVVVPALYAADADVLQPGALPKSCVIDCDYYRDSATAPPFDADAAGRGHGSIGGCPVPRGDSYAADYTASYVSRIARIVEGVRRASGSDRVDFLVHSMGNVVGRAYIRWQSLGAQGGKSKVRRFLGIAGPNRGIDALEATIDGLRRPQGQEHMAMGEDAEMSYEYPAWGGRSYMDLLNAGWDAFCVQNDVHYAGLTGTGAFGEQIDPSPGPPPSFGNGIVLANLPNPWDSVTTAVSNLDGNTILDVLPHFLIAAQRPAAEIAEALGPSDDEVRFESSGMDQPPFLGRDFFAVFEGSHGDEWNPEQTVHTATFTAELARQYFAEAGVVHSATIARASLDLVDAPGRASFLALSTTVKNGPLVSAQIVEENLDASGTPVGAAVGYGVPIPDGDQRAFIAVPRGGGTRRYRLVLYGPDGAAQIQDGIVYHLTDGTPEVAPVTMLASVTSSPMAAGAVARVTFASSVPASEPSLEFSWRLDGGAWTAWAKGASHDVGPLAPGEHRLEARSRHAVNGAGLLCEDAAGSAVGLFVSPSLALVHQP